MRVNLFIIICFSDDEKAVCLTTTRGQVSGSQWDSSGKWNDLQKVKNDSRNKEGEPQENFDLNEPGSILV